ncbi:cyclic nucleotide-binding domain-containing protein [Bradyrhizobium elkanii]|uniref:cyclic nucleotide-binding domain-containing protein n=1 Tax=Bradyrhizobium elkanii TaxID=29448 RepID=UPI001BA86374|nr:cyclic nucleotide-binding domain-containing protein [Bradyrhizobium elkanii]MBR1164493.1 cyclic nucleotide-binding domain-containing protein [Bradyrhizobium elkanii]
MLCSDVLLCGAKSWVEAAGYLASLLVFATFCMKTMLPLRIAAILSNVAFIAYAFFDGLYPILILHSVLLPLNVIRTVQMLRLRRIVEQASKGEFATEPLCPFMKSATWKAGEIIFRQGDYADRIYLLAKGSVRLNEIDLVLGAGELFGEIGVFSTAHERTQTAQAISDVELLWLTEGELAQVCHANPALAFHFLKLSINRLLANTGRQPGRSFVVPVPPAGENELRTSTREIHTYRSGDGTTSKDAAASEDRCDEQMDLVGMPSGAHGSSGCCRRRAAGFLSQSEK